MPVITQCPRCRHLLPESPDRQPCPRCGEAVIAVTSKLCSRCNKDITQLPKFADAQRSLYCQPCYVEACAEAGIDPTFRCRECGGFFPGDQIYEEKDKFYQLKSTFVCKKCFEARGKPFNPKVVEVLSELAELEVTPGAVAMTHNKSLYTQAVADKMADRARRTRNWIIVGCVVGLVIIVALTAWSIWTKSPVTGE